LDRERTEFFDTRVTGRMEIWQTLRVALEIIRSERSPENEEAGFATAQQILDAAEITLPTGDLVNGAYDGFGAFYALPAYIVCDPTNIAQEEPVNVDDGDKGEGSEELDEDEILKRREEKGKGVLNPADQIHVKARLSDGGGPDLRVSIGKDDSVRLLARRLLEESGVSATSHKETTGKLIMPPAPSIKDY
jgi:hypothetical protein